MVRSSTVLLLAGLLVAGLLAVGATTALDAGQADGDQNRTAQAVADEHEPTITVTGTGDATAEPDRATVQLAVVETAENSTVAADRLASNASRLRSALEASELVEDVQSTDYGLREQRSERPPEPPQRADGGDGQFLARQTFEVVVADPDDAGSVVDLAVSNGTSEVRGVAFTLSEARHREVRAEAIDRAVADAESQATAIATSTDLSVGDVQSVQSHERGLQPVHREAADDAAIGTEIDVRDVTVDASVEISYEASETD